MDARKRSKALRKIGVLKTRNHYGSQDIHAVLEILEDLLKAQTVDIEDADIMADIDPSGQG